MENVEEKTFGGESAFSKAEEPKQEMPEFTIEEMMRMKISSLIADRQDFMKSLSRFIHQKGTSNKRVLKIVQYGLFRNTEFRDSKETRLLPGTESAIGEQLRNLLDDEMAIGHLQFALASQQDDLLNESNPQMKEQQEEIETKGIDIPDYAKEK